MKTCAAVQVQRYFTFLKIQKIRNLVSPRGYVLACLKRLFPHEPQPLFQINLLLTGERDINQNLDS